MAEIWDNKFPWSIEAQHASGKCLGILPTLDYNHKLHTVRAGGSGPASQAMAGPLFGQTST